LHKQNFFLKYSLSALLWGWLTLATVLVSFGQLPPYTACFTVDQDRGCAPHTVTVTSCSYSGSSVGQPDPLYYYDFENFPGIFVQSTTHTYTTPGKYVIRQAVNDGINSIVYTTDTIEVLGRPAPVFDPQLCMGRILRISFTDTIYDSFLINYGDGNTDTALPGDFTSHTYAGTSAYTLTITGRYNTGCTSTPVTQTIRPIDNLISPDPLDLTVTNASEITLRMHVLEGRRYELQYKINNGAYSASNFFTATANALHTYTQTGLDTENNTYTFRLRNTDVCGNVSAFSAELASIRLNANALNGSNQVTFLSNGGLTFGDLSLFRNNSLLQSNAISPYADNTISCNQEYCYRIQGTHTTSNTTTGQPHLSYSAIRCVTASYIGAAPALSNVNSTVEGASIKIVWDTPPLHPSVPGVGQYQIRRNEGSGFVAYANSNTHPYIDPNVAVATSAYCYQLAYTDACGNAAPVSLTTCPVVLTLNRTDETNHLSWTNYTGYASGIQAYILENLDEQGNVVLSKSVGLANSFSEVADPSLAQIIYRIRVVANGSENIVSYSNVVLLDLTPQVYMPTVFTPNGDGENDVLEVKGKYFNSIRMTILNKWGEVVFFSDDVHRGWDGMHNGQPASVDSYVYLIEATDNTGEKVSLKGVVSLLR
jgi:gliding motility-associated-like protein